MVDVGGFDLLTPSLNSRSFARQSLTVNIRTAGIERRLTVQPEAIVP